MGPHRFRCLPHSLWIGAVLLVVCCSASLLPSPDAGWAVASRQRRSQADSPMRQFVREGLADLGRSEDEIDRQIAEWSYVDRATSEVEERKAASIKPVSKSNWKKFKENDALRDQIGGALPGVMGSVATLATMDFKNSSPKQIAKAVGDVAIPIIAAGLALIPLVGPIISGLFTGIWGLVSSLWLEKEEEKESPMEKMIKEAMKQMREEVDAKMGAFLTNVIRGELSRNRYVCDKYAIIAQNFTENYVAGDKHLNDSFRLEMIMFMDNCDNFLQDTLYGFQNHKFPDALWQVSAMAALAQIAFLADSINVGGILKLPQKFLTNYFSQLEKTLDDQFKLFKDGQPLRQNKLKEKPYSTEELESCRTQAQLIYMNRDLYPYGMPRKFTTRDLRSFELDAGDLTLQGPKTNTSIDHDHIQIFATETDDPAAFDNWGQVNCFMGAIFAPFYQRQDFQVKVSFVAGHSFELRVLYFTRFQTVNRDSYPGKWNRKLTMKEKHRKAVAKSNNDGQLQVLIEENLDSDNVHVLFEAESGCISFRCVGNLAPLNEETLEYEPCWSVTESAHDGGMFYIDEVGFYNVDGTGRSDMTIEVKKDSNTFVVGIELIIHKKVE